MLQEGLYSLLISTSSITDLVGVRGVFSGKAPEAPTLPIIVIEQIGGEGLPVFEGTSALRKARLTLSCYANSNQGVKTLMKAVRDLLDGWKGPLPDGTDVDLGQVILEAGSFEFAPFIYKAPLDIEFWFREGDGSGGGGGGGGTDFVAAGDLSGTSTLQTVIGLEGKPLDAATVGAPSDGQVITYDGASGTYHAKTPAGLTLARMLQPAVVTPPVLSSLTWENQGNSTTSTNTGGALYISGVNPAGGDDVRLLYKAAPAPPWTLTVGVVPAVSESSGLFGGIILRNSVTGQLYLQGAGSNTSDFTFVFNYSDNHTIASQPAIAYTSYRPVSWMQVHCDGTNYVFYLSPDGQSWSLMTQVAMSAFTADQVGIGCDFISSMPNGVLFVHWAGI